VQTRRTIVLVAILMGITALVATIAAPNPRLRQPSAAVPSPSAAPSATASAGVDQPDVSAVIEAGSERRRTVHAEVGDHVELVVQGSQIDSVALGDLDVEDLEPGVPARFELLADTPGSYPLVLVNANRRIATLQVR
jgi:hypothetical protein